MAARGGGQPPSEPQHLRPRLLQPWQEAVKDGEDGGGEPAAELKPDQHGGHLSERDEGQRLRSGVGRDE